MTTVEGRENPFAAVSAAQPTDEQLVAAALAGDHRSLEDLLSRHQPWIYNLALRMVMVPADAEDVTQEVLVKVLTKLGTYDPARAAFRTWLYRIVTNHVLNMKPRGFEPAITDFETYYSFIDRTPDQEPDETAETALVVEDLKIGCVMGTLLCLTRMQRLTFILTIAFGVSDAVGSELLGVSQDVFRKNLSRARARLRQYVGGNCGLVNREARCHCRNKVKTFIDSGAYSVESLHYLAPDRPAMNEIVGRVERRFGEALDDRLDDLIGSHPFFKGKDAVSWLRGLLEDPAFEKAFALN